MTKVVRKVVGKRARTRTAARRGRPPGQLSDETRKRILAGARDCFVRLGFERATNKDIAAAAGITAAALYRYFSAKSQIYAAVVDESSARQVSRLGPLVASAESVKLGFAALLRTLVDDSQNTHARFLSGVPTEMQRHPEISKHMIAKPGEIYVILRSLIERGIRTGEVPREKAERTVAFMIASFIGMSSYINTLGRAQGELAVAGLLDLLEGQLFRPAAEPDG